MAAAVLWVRLALQKPARRQRLNRNRGNAALDSAHLANIPRGVLRRVVGAKHQHVKTGLVQPVLPADRLAQRRVSIRQLFSECNHLNRMHKKIS